MLWSILYAIQLMENQQGGFSALFGDRKRTHLLRNWEQAGIVFLLKLIPRWISPNGMTLIGFIGSLIVMTAFIMGATFHSGYLILGIFGLLLNWFGDSMDGRLAYYRNIPRKWYGFALDISMDWCSIGLIMLGYHYYASHNSRFLALLFALGYGWSMLIALLRYKITNQYQIDSGWVGPTELRVVIAFILIIEAFVPGSITIFASVLTFILLVVNGYSTRLLLNEGNKLDARHQSKTKDGD